MPCFFLIIFSMLCLGLFSAQAQVKGPLITITADQLSLKDIFRQIEQKAQVVINYNEETVDGALKVSVKVSQASVSQTLQAVLKNTPYEFVNSGGAWIIRRKTAPVTARAPGRVSGTVMDEETGEPVIGASIRIGGNGITTDENGAFSIPLPKGKYEAEISFIGYGTKKVTDIIIKDETNFALKLSLKKEKGQLSTVVVSARRIRETGTTAAVLDEMQKSDAVVSGISKEQIGRSQDRDAAQVVRRVPGVSIIENRFVVVRGLPQRYNSVLLNNATAPGFDADSRAFSFETIPSGMIDRVMIYKTAVPELPGDFAGGVVKVYTTGLPQKNEFRITYQSSVRPNTTFRNFGEQKQGSKAWLGYDDGTYSDVFDTKARTIDIDKLKKEKEIYWEPGQKTAPLDHRLNLELSHLWKLSPNTRIGITTAGGYSNTYESKRISVNRILSNSEYKKVVPFYTFADKDYVHDIRVNALANLSIELGNGKHLIAFKNLYTHLGSFLLKDRKGISHTDAEDGIGFYEKMLMKQTIQGNSFKGIYNTQLTGKHKLFTALDIDWTLGYTKSNFEDPDQRSRVWTTPRQGNQVDAEGNIQWQELYNVQGVGNSMRWRRNFIFMPEEIRTAAIDVSNTFNIGRFQPVIRAGGYFEKRERQFSFMGATLNAPSSGGPADQSYYIFYPTPEGSFDAGSNLRAGYLALQLPIGNHFKLYGGVRLEDYHVTVKSFSWATVGDYVGMINVDKQKLNYLPSLNLVYSFSPGSQLRAAYSKTLNRAEFREMAATKYLDMSTFKITYGNPDLKPQVPIQNIDLRYELYPGAGETFSFGLFYKHVDSPPELYNQDMGGSGNTYFWGNAKEATIYGAELELMLGMSRFFKGSSWMQKQLQKMSVLLNTSYAFGSLQMQDTITLFGIKNTFGSSIIKNRLMYGQSPYMVNAAVNFADKKNGIDLTLSYNIIGKRIVFVGSLNNPNVWEMPRHSLDLSFSKSIIKHLELRGGIQNILNSRFRWMQDSNYDGKIDKHPDVGDYSVSVRDNMTNSWYEGTYYTLGVSFKL